MPVRKDGEKRTAGEGKQLGGPTYVDREWVMGLATRKQVLVSNGRQDAVALGGRNNVTVVWDRVEARPRVFVTRELPTIEGVERRSVTVEIFLEYNDKGKIERPDMLMVLGVLGAEVFSFRSRVEG